jgi:hypothetical protein
MVEEVVPGSAVRYHPDGGPDKRCYRVNCDKIRHVLPGFKPQWTVRRGIEELYAAYVQEALAIEDFTGPRYLRIKHVKELQGEGRLDESMRWIPELTEVGA